MLKLATDPVHARLDRALSDFDLADEADYRGFLLAQAPALLAVEGALAACGFGDRCPGWQAARRSDAMLADLAGLDAAMPRPTVIDPIRGAAGWGAAYVLEGSRLGAKLLARRVREGGAPLVVANMRFLTHDGGLPWRSFIALLDAALPHDEDLQEATHGALVAFGAFEKGARGLALDNGHGAAGMVGAVPVAVVHQ